LINCVGSPNLKIYRLFNVATNGISSPNLYRSNVNFKSIRQGSENRYRL